MTLLYWEWHLIPRWPLRSIFAWFLEQLLKDLVSWGSPGECSLIDRFLGDAFGVLSCQFWSTVLQSGARLPIHTLNYCMDRAVSGARFLTGGVFECDIAYRRSVAIHCMLYKTRCNPMHPFNCALPGSYVPVRVIRGALGYTYTPPRCRTSQYSRTFIPLSVSLGNDLANPVFDCVGLVGFRSRANAFYWLNKLLYPNYNLLLFLSFSSFCL